jgi:hypothetical protein
MGSLAQGRGGEECTSKDETCPLSTGGRTRRVQLVQGGGGRRACKVTRGGGLVKSLAWMSARAACPPRCTALRSARGSSSAGTRNDDAHAHACAPARSRVGAVGGCEGGTQRGEARDCDPRWHGTSIDPFWHGTSMRTGKEQKEAEKDARRRQRRTREGGREGRDQGLEVRLHARAVCTGRGHGARRAPRELHGERSEVRSEDERVGGRDATPERAPEGRGVST